MYWKRVLLVFVLWSATTMLLQNTANAQDTLWTRTFGSTEDDHGYSVQQTSDGGYIIAAGTKASGSGGYDVYLIKTDANGDTLWTRTFGSPSGREIPFSVQQTTDGGYIIAGVNETSGGGLGDVYLVKTDANGDTLWTKTFGDTLYDIGYSIHQTTDGGYIIAGGTDSYGAGGMDVYLIKTDANGDTLWTKTFGGPDPDGHWVASIQQTADGGYIITSSTESYGAGGEDLYLIKTDGNGDTLWTRTYGVSDDDCGYSVQQTTDGGYIITGFTLRPSGWGDYDVWLLKVSSTGVEETVFPGQSKEIKVFPTPTIGLGGVQFSICLPHNSLVELKVFDVSGRLIDVREWTLDRGSHKLSWSNRKGGIYFFRFNIGGAEIYEKAIIF